MSYKIGDIIEGTVTGIQNYGAFVALDEETQGLIHISELKHGYVDDIHEFLEVGQKVKVIIMDIDEYSQKISLSMRALTPAPTHPFSNRKKIKRYGKRTGIGFESIDRCLDQQMADAVKFLNLKTNNKK